MTDKRKDCPMRHENGNCLCAGGFCTSVNDPICEALHHAYDCGYRAAALREHGGKYKCAIQWRIRCRGYEGDLVYLQANVEAMRNPFTYERKISFLGYDISIRTDDGAEINLDCVQKSEIELQKEDINEEMQ